jgi:hypothetical protein
MKILQILVTLIFSILAVEHAFYGYLRMDAITIILIVIAFIPWLREIIQSIELPGGVKVELREFQKVTKEAESAGLIETGGLLGKTVTNAKTPKYSFQLVANEDPKLALAGLRIEIEKRLDDIAERHELNISRKGIKSLLMTLTENNLLTVKEKMVLDDLVGLLNNAVHAKDVDNDAALWALDIGPQILRSLDKKIK